MTCSEYTLPGPSFRETLPLPGEADRTGSLSSSLCAVYLQFLLGVCSPSIIGSAAWSLGTESRAGTPRRSEFACCRLGSEPSGHLLPGCPFFSIPPRGSRSSALPNNGGWRPWRRGSGRWPGWDRGGCLWLTRSCSEMQGGAGPPGAWTFGQGGGGSTGSRPRSKTTGQGGRGCRHLSSSTSSRYLDPARPIRGDAGCQDVHQGWIPADALAATRCPEVAGRGEVGRSSFVLEPSRLITCHKITCGFYSHRDAL